MLLAQKESVCRVRSASGRREGQETLTTGESRERKETAKLRAGRMEVSFAREGRQTGKLPQCSGLKNILGIWQNRRYTM